MNAADTKFVQGWPKKLKKGKEEFIVLHGIIAWALPTGVGIQLIRQFFMGEKFDAFIVFALYVPLWVAAGVWFGNSQWKKSKERYAKLTSQE
jgi:hypothetical protein